MRPAAAAPARTRAPKAAGLFLKPALVLDSSAEAEEPEAEEGDLAEEEPEEEAEEPEAAAPEEDAEAEEEELAAEKEERRVSTGSQYIT